MDENITEHISYERGYQQGVKARTHWNDIMKHTPEKRKQLIYFHDMTGGPHIGYYFGIDETYPGENNHVFGSRDGFLTGDATHWMYMPDPPFEDEHLNERRDEWLVHMEKLIWEAKQPINLD